MATIANLVVNLSANTADLFTTFDRDTAKLEKSLGKMGQSFANAGKTLTAGLTLPLAGLAGGALKAASDFESSFAGVRKTVDATEPEFQKMAQSFRDIAKEIPVSVDELNALGESAGALGIPKGEIVGFAKVMAELGVTTNLTSDEAANAIARIQNIFGAAGQDTDRFASTLVALGNAGASTEKEITEMAQRIAGAGHAVGLSEAEVASFASTLASVGINAEAGGSAISRAFLKMNDAVLGGGKALTEIAGVAGMTAGEFKQKFEQDAAGAMVAFISGLDGIKQSGGNVNATIEDTIGKSIIIKDTLLRVAGAGSLLSDQLKIGTQAWQDNNAMTNEAEQRFKTTASQLQVLWNNIKDVSITLGQALLPFLQSAIARFKDWIPYLEGAANWFAELSPRTQTIILAVGALAAGLGPVLLAFGTMATAISTLIPIVSGLGGIFTTSLLPFLGPAGLIAAGVAAVYLAWKNWDSIAGIAKAVYTAIKDWLVDKFNGVVESIKGKVDSVTGFFKGMYEAVVGHSFVPDMVRGIASEFGKLDTVMVGPTGKAASGVMGLFQNLASQLPSMLSGLFSGGSGGGLGGMLSGLLSGGSGGGLLGGGITKGITSMFNAASPAITSVFGLGLSSAMGAALPGIGAALAPLLTKGLGKLWDGLKNIGGPSQAELNGRDVAGSFRTDLEGMLTATQAIEAGNDQWKKSVIVVRDAYIAAGHTSEEALGVMDRLWRAEKQGGTSVQTVIDEITRTMSGSLTPATETATKSAALGFEQVRSQVDVLKNQAIGSHNAGLIQAVTSLEYQMQLASENGVTDFGFMTDEIEKMKKRIAAPITIDIIMRQVGELPKTFTSPTDSKDVVSSDWQVAGMGGSWEKAYESFMKNNPGDEGRFLAAMADTGRISEALHNTPGFAGGTGGRFVDFGRESVVRLHGRERVVTEAEDRRENSGSSSDMMADMLHLFRREMPRLIKLMAQESAVLAR